MFKNLLIAAGVLIAAVLAFAATRPEAFHVERSISVKAAPEKLFPYINDFHQWDAWTPYNKDPAMKKTFSGAASGKGAAYAWEGNSDVGQGAITLTEATPPSSVSLDLHMIKPFEGRNRVIFTLRPTADGTAVTWAMDGNQAYVAKVMGLFVNMDQMVGRDFEVGLAKLKAIGETN